MIWQLVHGCDFEKAKIPLFVRSPYLEIEALFTDQQVISFLIDLKQSPVLSKTFRLLFDQCFPTFFCPRHHYLVFEIFGS